MGPRQPHFWRGGLFLVVRCTPVCSSADLVSVQSMHLNGLSLPLHCQGPRRAPTRAVRGFTGVHNDGARRSRGGWVDSGSPWQRRGTIGGSHVLDASFCDGRGGRVCSLANRDPRAVKGHVGGLGTSWVRALLSGHVRTALGPVCAYVPGHILTFLQVPWGCGPS